MAILQHEDSGAIGRSTIADDIPKLFYKFLLPGNRRPDGKEPLILDRRIPHARMGIHKHPSSFVQHAPRSGDVPRKTATLPKCILLACRDTANSLDSRPRATQRIDELPTRSLAPRKRREDLQIQLEIRTLAVTPPVQPYARILQARQRTPVERQHLRLRGRAALVEGAAAAHGREQLVGEGVQHDADGGPLRDDEAQRDADGGEAVDEVGGAVDGIDDEAGHVGDALFRLERLLADEVVLGVARDQARGDQVLDGLVGLGDDVGGWVGERVNEKRFV